MKSKYFVTLFLCLSFGFQSQASNVQYIRPDYYLGELVKNVLWVAGHLGIDRYIFIEDDPFSVLKTQNCLDRIYENPHAKYTFDKVAITLIKGVPEEPNAFAFGNHIFVSQSLVSLLNARQLTAVLAHELAHSESAHHLQRTPLPLEAAIYQLKTIYDKMVEGNWPSKADILYSMDNLTSTGGLAMELQADCIAAQQLEHMRKKGLRNQPEDLISATNKIMGYDVSKDTSDDPTVVRVKVLLSKSYLYGSCDIF